MPTPAEFIEQWPLYTRADIRDFGPPGSITRMCDMCGKETTWRRDAAQSLHAETSPSIIIQAAGYTCGLCEKNSVLVLYQALDHWADGGFWSSHGVKKIGQLPPQSIEIPTDLTRRLGPTAGFYKNALVCRSHSFGIGAVAYLRRVVEEKTDELIDVIVELAQTHGMDEKTMESLAGAKKQVRYEDKLRVASEIIPNALRPGGVNPLGQLYTHLSIGLHGKTDDECVAIFDDLREDFEFIFRKLHVEAQERREFAERVQRRAGTKT